MKENKKASAIVWILIIAIVLVICFIIAWLVLSGNDTGSILGSGGSSIPQPPALPD